MSDVILEILKEWYAEEIREEELLQQIADKYFGEELYSDD